MELSARNVLEGTVKEVNLGMVNAEVVVELASGVELVSVITKGSSERLGLPAGKKVYAVVKASNVMIATE